MKKLITFISLTLCTTAFAASDAAFVKQANDLMKQQSTSYSIADQLMEITMDRELNAAETAKYNAAVCSTVAIESKFADLLLSNLEQARLFLEDDKLTEADISNMKTSSISYEAAQELVGTPAECK